MKPPQDADPEKFIIGRGVYSNRRTARPYHDARVFRIDPTPVPVMTIVIYNLIFAAFFFGFHWLVKYHTDGEAGPWMVYGAPIGVGLLTCILFSAVTWYSFDKANRLGPWLIYDKTTGTVTLPRDKVQFKSTDIVQLQCIPTKRLDWGDVINNDRVSELNLITSRNGERKRWPLLRSISNGKSFNYLLDPMVAQTRLPVMCVEDELMSWKITETPYSGIARKG